MLHVHRNKLKKLPDSLGKLGRLQTLDASGNALKDLPWSSLGGLPRLRTLDLSGNPKLRRLGRDLARARGLERLSVDSEAMQHPDKGVCQGGTEAIMRFLCKGEEGFVLSLREHMCSKRGSD